MAQGQYPDAQHISNARWRSERRRRRLKRRPIPCTTLAIPSREWDGHHQASQRYVRALEFRRTAGDKRNAALASYGIGTIFDYQGRYGSAVKSKGEALQAFRDLKQQDIWLGEILSGYGNSLNLSGRMRDAQAPLDEALKLAKT